MKPPFSGIKFVEKVPIELVYQEIDTNFLFTGQWQFKRSVGSEAAYQEILKSKAWPKFEELKKQLQNEKILEPKIVYGYFETATLADLSVKKKPSSEITPLQIVTIGGNVAKKCQWLFAAHSYTEYLYIHGLAVAATEALAEYSHKMILKELKYEGKSSRISPGYPAWPNLSDQKKLCSILDSRKIGVEITETFQLIPEYSTSAMILVD